MAIKCINDVHGDGFAAYHGDCVEVVSQLPDNSIGHAIYSPPFSNLYIYSESERDMGNSASDDEFLEHYRFLVREIYRCLKPGRIAAVHCKDLVNYKGRDGMAGLRDFPGELIRIHQEEGFSYHSKCTIWKDPVIEMQRTKAHGLLYKQLRADSTFSRQGMAEYLIAFRKWADDDGVGVEPVTHTRTDFELDQWQRWASPIWMDIRQTHVLNVQAAREDQDEKHICPLQLDVIERSLVLWSNPGDVVLSPFMGIGSEGYVSLQQGRKFVGVELKESYFQQSVKNLQNATLQSSLFSEACAV
jgi:DNA modification methylase